MLSVQRLKEISSTIRFRLVLWITLIVFLMVLATNLAVREVVQSSLHYEYDQFLENSLKEVQMSVKAYYPADKQKLFAVLEDKARAYHFRGWFVQLFDEGQHMLWMSKGAPSMAVSASF